MIEAVKAPECLAVDGLLIQFNENRQKAIKSYRQLVVEGNKNDVQIPKVQKRAKALSLKEYKQNDKERNTAIYNAYSSGAYSYKEIGDYFGLHFVTVGKIVRDWDPYLRALEAKG